MSTCATYALPFFAEKASNLWMPSEDPAAIRWQQTIARFDGYIFVVAEYNRSITGALKRTPSIRLMSSGIASRSPPSVMAGVGAARAIEHLRLIGIELQMVPTRSAVHIGGGDFMAVSPMGANKPIEDIEANLLPSAKAALDDLVWWARATKAAKAG